MLRPFLPELAVAAVVVLGTVGYGIAWGEGSPVTECTTRQVDPLSVFGVNLALCLLLISGAFTYGASTLAAAVYVLAPTGAAIGSITARFGTEGVLLLAPHGVLEALACVLATAVGLQQPVTQVRDRVRAARGAPSVERPGLVTVAGAGIVVVAVVLLLAGVVESMWTGWYGQRIHC